METFNRLEHPVLEVAIGGATVEQRPSSFSLITDSGLPSVTARLQFPRDTDIGANGGPVAVTLSYTDERHLLFTGEIYSSGTHGIYRDLALTDGYKSLCDTSIAVAYRKELARVILEDTLEAAGIVDTAITCPAVEIARFSTETIPADKVITLLIKTLEEHGHYGLRFFFDERNVFRLGTLEDTGRNEGASFAFASGTNIVKTGDGKIDVLPLPIRHSQAVTVDGKSCVTTRTDLYVSGNRSRLTLWLEGTV